MREGEDSVEAISSRTAAENGSHSQHSPLPWRIERGVCKNDHPHTSADVIDAEGVFVANCGCTCWAVPNTDLIVRAVNCHDALLAALKVLVDAYEDPQLDDPHALVLVAKDAIEKAEGR